MPQRQQRGVALPALEHTHSRSTGKFNTGTSLAFTTIMALGLEGYGSGSDSDSDNETTQVAQPAKSTATQASSSASKLSLPPPKTSQTRTGAKKVKIGLPSLKPTVDDEDDLEARSEMSPFSEGEDKEPENT